MPTHHRTSQAVQISSMRICAQCGETLSAPDWSEPSRDRRRIRHVWNRHACGCAFETQARFPEPNTTAQAEVERQYSSRRWA